MKPWLRFSSLVLFSLVVAGGLFLSGVQQFAPEEARADVTATPWPPTATTGTHLMVDTFTSSSTWTAPAGVTSVVVEAWGAGGAARVGSDGGGGGGAYVRSLVSVTPGEVYWIQVGSDLAGNFSPTSTFATTTVVAAPGWSFAQGGAPGAAASSTGDVEFNGGGGEDGGPSAGDRASAVSNLGGEENGAAGATSVDKIQSSPGGGSFDNNDRGVRGQVRISYSSTTLSSFPYVRGRTWERGTQISTSSVDIPSSTQIGDLIVAVVSVSLAGTTSTVNGDGWNKIGTFSSPTMASAVFWKVAEGSDALVASTTGSNLSWSSMAWSIVNADSAKIFIATSSVVDLSYDPPSLDTGVSDKYLWLDGGHSFLGGNTSFCFVKNVGTDSFLSQSQKVVSAGGYPAMISSEAFKEDSIWDPAAFQANGDGCSTTPNPRTFSYTIAIAGLASEEEEPSTTVNTATPSTGWSGGFSTWFNNNF